MHIAELQKKYDKYGLDKRTIDYYSSIGLIQYDTEPGTNYRIYGKKAENVIKKIIILRGAGLSSKEIQKAINDPSYFTTEKWNEQISKLEKKREQLNEMIKNAKAMRDTHAFTFFDYFPDIDEDEDIDGVIIGTQAGIHVIAKVIKYIESPELLNELSEELPSEIGDFSNRCAVFLNSLRKKKEQGLSPDSAEVRRSVDVFVGRMLELYGVGVYLLVTCINDMNPLSLGLDKDETQEYTIFMEGLNIVANWFRESKSIEKAKETDIFKEQYKEDILAFDKKIGESTEDDLVKMIEDICELPYKTTKESREEYLDKLLEVYYLGIEAGVKEEGAEISEEEITELKEYGIFVKEAIKNYLNSIS